jgi:outer membrane protein
VDLQASRVDNDNGINNNDVASSQINLQLTMPLYSGGAVSSRSREAAYNYEASRQTPGKSAARTSSAPCATPIAGRKPPSARSGARSDPHLHPQRLGSQSRPAMKSAPAPSATCWTPSGIVYLAERNYAAARYTYVTNYLTLRQAAGQLAEVDMAEINRWLGPPRSDQPAIRPRLSLPDSTKTKAAGLRRKSPATGGIRQAAAQTTARAPTSPAAPLLTSQAASTPANHGPTTRRRSRLAIQR